MDPVHSNNSGGTDSKPAEPEKKKRKKDKHTKKKRKRSSSSSSASSSSSSHRKHKKKRKKIKKKKKRASPPVGPQPVLPSAASATVTPSAGGLNLTAPGSASSDAPTDRPKGPMTKEQWDAQQSVVRRVYDPDTQRMRLVKGDGEIIEEIVSRERHLAINKNATRADGATFQANLGLNKR